MKKVYDSKALVDMFDQMAQEPESYDRNRVVDLTKVKSNKEKQIIVNKYCNKFGVQYRRPKFIK